MTLWLDNRLPPALAGWMRATTSIECLPVRDLNLQRASDHEIFAAARHANVVVMTKDADFVEETWKATQDARLVGTDRDTDLTPGVQCRGR